MLKCQYEAAFPTCLESWQKHSVLGMENIVTWDGPLLGCSVMGVPGSWWSASGTSLGIGYCCFAKQPEQERSHETAVFFPSALTCRNSKGVPALFIHPVMTFSSLFGMIGALLLLG